ncbi:unnamed protein product, partial [marine sediment metagenome]
MKEGLKRLYRGDFNVMTWQGNPDGSATITLTKQGEKKAYQFRVK